MHDLVGVHIERVPRILQSGVGLTLDNRMHIPAPSRRGTELRTLLKSVFQKCVLDRQFWCVQITLSAQYKNNTSTVLISPGVFVLSLINQRFGMRKNKGDVFVGVY